MAGIESPSIASSSALLLVIGVGENILYSWMSGCMKNGYKVYASSYRVIVGDRCAPSAQLSRANNAHNFNEISKCLPTFVPRQNPNFSAQLYGKFSMMCRGL